MTDDSSPSDGDAADGETADGSDQTVCVLQSDWTAFENPSVAVVRAVAAVTNSDPVELSTLYDSIDPFALDALMGAVVDEAATDASVTFPYEGFTVDVQGDGTLTVSVDSTDAE